MNQGKSDIIAKRKVQVLFRNKNKNKTKNKTKQNKTKKPPKYDNHMQIMLININDVTIWMKKGMG